MDKGQHSAPAVDEEQLIERAASRLPQPGQTKISAVLNGMGNGATVGVATYALPKAYAILTHKPVPADNVRGTLFATVIGTAIGTWYGLQEAKSIEEYRDSIGKEIIHLRDRVKVLEGNHATKHADKIIAEREMEADASPAR